MNKERILESAINKAVKNGYKWEIGAWMGDPYEALVRDGMYFNIIFSHDFAKAFWGDNRKTNGINRPDWQFHLQQMVLEKEPLKYLEQFL